MAAACIWMVAARRYSQRDSARDLDSDANRIRGALAVCRGTTDTYPRLLDKIIGADASDTGKGPGIAGW